MSNNKNDNVKKDNSRSHSFKRRLKSSVVRDPNGSVSTFRRFYQSGGRDYEQYRLWLQTLTKPEQTSTASDKIKTEPIDLKHNEVTILSSTLPIPRTVHTQQSLPSLRVARTHSLFKPVSDLSLPFPTLNSSLLTATTFEPQIHVSCDHSNVSTVANSTSSIPSINWSVTDVGRFIEKNFPEKNLARKFIQQKIDGRTLPLLTEDHLTRIFKMKLGPALYLLTLISKIQIQN